VEDLAPYKMEITGICNPNNGVTLKLASTFQAENYTLLKPNGTEVYGKDFSISSQSQEGVYTVISPFTLDQECKSEQFRVLGGQGAPQKYSGDTDLSGTTFLVNDITIEDFNHQMNGVASISLLEDAKLFVLTRGLFQKPADIDDPESAAAGGYVSGCNIFMTSRSAFTMGPGSSVQGICGMWGGIYPTNYGYINLEGTQNKKVVFQDAYSGIYVDGGFSFVEANHVTFKNNIYSITDKQTSFNNQSVVNNCIFTTNSTTMKAPFALAYNAYGDPFYSYGMYGIAFKANNYQTISNNTFENLHYGIKGEGTNVGSSLNTNSFKDCFLSAIISKGIDFILSGNSFSYPNRLEPNHQAYYQDLGFETELGNTFSADYKYPIGIYCKNGDQGSLSLGSNYFNGFYAPSSQVTNKFSFLKGTAISLSTTSISIEGAQFDKWKQAIRFRNVAPNSYIPKIKGCVFNANARAIELETPTGTSMGLDLSCSIFEHRLPDVSQTGGFWNFSIIGGISPIGINILTGGELGIVGIPNPATGLFGPGANVFPVASTTNRTVLPASGDVETGTGAWSSPTDWVSINNEGSSEMKYLRWKNEFLGTVMPTSGITKPELTLVSKYAIPFNQTPNSTQVQVDCDNIDVSIYFPAARSVSNPLPNGLEDAKSHLYQSIPNPAGTNDVVIPYHIVEPFSTAQIEIFELTNGKKISLIPLEELSGKVNISTKGLNSGIYGYRLIVDNKTIETRKMVLVK